MSIEYPQGAPEVKNRRALRIVLASILGAAVIVAGSWGAVAYANGITAERAHVAAVAFKHSADAAMPQLQANTATAADESDDTSADQVVAAEQAREAAAAAAIAAQQAADDAVAKAATEAGRDKCPAGSSATSGDGNVDLTCLPNICFNLTLPDPNHPECDASFKP